ncbi:MAG: LapA family protein [Pseudanabaenaceae cyanobacterium]
MWLANMRQINFAVIFVMVLALVLFSLENTSSVSIQLLPTLKYEAPLAIELIVAMGIGAVLAWLFSLWSSLQSALELRNKNRQISNLQEKVSTLAAQIEERKQLVAASAIDVEVEEKAKSETGE